MVESYESSQYIVDLDLVECAKEAAKACEDGMERFRKIFRVLILVKVVRWTAKVRSLKVRVPNARISLQSGDFKNFDTFVFDFRDFDGQFKRSERLGTASGSPRDQPNRIFRLWEVSLFEAFSPKEPRERWRRRISFGIFWRFWSLLASSSWNLWLK